MFYTSSLPIAEKIYLSDGSLSYAQDLNVGDKILSIRVTQDGVEDVSDIFTKIIAKDRIVHEYEVCEATVYSAEGFDQQSFGYINNNKIQHNQYIAIKLTDLGFDGYEAKYNEIKNKENALVPFTISNVDEIVKSGKKGYGNSYTLKKNLDLSFTETKILSTPPASNLLTQAYSLKLIGGHFYFTQNFIILSDGIG
jgi:hypothetical protein